MKKYSNGNKITINIIVVIIYFLLIPATNKINNNESIYAIAVPKSGSNTINKIGINANNNILLNLLILLILFLFPF